jgi:hypothetical protein
MIVTDDIGRRIVIAVACLALVGFAIWVEAPASSGAGFDYAECSYSEGSGVLRVRVNDEEGLVERRGERIVVRVPTGRGGHKTVPCDGGQATVSNTDRIRLRIRFTGFSEGRISLAGGAFEPGRSAEPDGTSEIELAASIAPGQQELWIEGTQGDDQFRGGQLGDSRGINLNPAEEEAPDSDLRIADTRGDVLRFLTGDGHDEVDISGGPEFSEPLSARFVVAALGRGADRFVADTGISVVRSGTGADEVSTGGDIDIVRDGSGDDRIETGAGRDGASLGHGRDRVVTGNGPDLVFARDRERDRIDCGPGRDRILADRRDLLHSCERVERV